MEEMVVVILSVPLSFPTIYLEPCDFHAMLMN